MPRPVVFLRPKGRAEYWTEEQLDRLVELDETRVAAVRSAYRRAVPRMLWPLLDAKAEMPDEGAPDV